uniref:G_PROTEIN_RECEP_F2_4 domain-containing protein n=1 Tax=Macrostomum lignano TaxID=282301 RepID=A0A1I8GQ53_9PLAT
FRYPERPIVWVSASHLLFAGAHLLRVWLGPQAAGCAVGDPAGQQVYRVSRHAGHWCAVIFLLVYFAPLAGCLWWLLLTVCWYLCAARKWAHEAIQQRSVWLHLLAWGAPLLLSVSLLVLHRVKADELTHLCVVDPTDRVNIIAFVISPTAACLAIGLGFLTSALCSSASVRHSLKWSGNEGFRRLEKLMTKICLLSFLFVLPTGCVLAVSLYELAERDKWIASLE